MELNFLCQKDFNRIEEENNIYIYVYCYENKLTFLIYISDQKIDGFVACNL